MKKFFVVIVIFVLTLFGCTGDIGPAGADGTVGNPGFAIYLQDGLNGYSGMVDALLSDTNPTTNYGSSNITALGYYVGMKRRPVMKFDFSSFVPSDATIVRAYLHFTCIALAGAGSIDYSIHEFTQDFTELGVTWLNTGTTAWTTPGGDFGAAVATGFTIVPNSENIIEIPVSVIQNWLDNPSQNHGIVLKQDVEAGNAAISFYTKEHTTQSQKPKLVLYVTLP